MLVEEALEDLDDAWYPLRRLAGMGTCPEKTWGGSWNMSVTEMFGVPLVSLRGGLSKRLFVVNLEQRLIL